MNYAYWRDFLASARNGHDRPVGNNTRVHWGAGWARENPDSRDIEIRYHSTDIVRFQPNGRRTLSNGGWYTVTTLQRLREYGSRYIRSERGDWYIPIEPDPEDLPPQAPTLRTIPKPFHATDPGPEPVDEDAGCVAGTSERYEYQKDEAAYEWQREREPGGFPIRVFYADGSGGKPGVRRTCIGVIEWGENSHRPWTAENYRDPDIGEYKQCPHCKAFKELHAQWDRAMHGCEYRGTERERVGYADMIENLERFGSREAWQEAYITEFRAVRENRRALKEWDDRNRVGFYSGIEVTPSGYVPLKAKKAHLKARRKVARVNRQHKRELDERAARRARHEQQRAEYKRVRRMMATAMAESIAVELSLKQQEWIDNGLEVFA